MHTQSTMSLVHAANRTHTEIDLAYTAGLFDGEGSVVITLNANQVTGIYHHKLMASVANTNFAIIDWLRERYGGHVTVHRVHGGNARDSARWQIGSRQAAQFLALIRPYLRMKGEQADIAAALQATRTYGKGWSRSLPGGGKGSLPLPPEIVAEREVLRARLHALNKRGIE